MVIVLCSVGLWTALVCTVMDKEEKDKEEGKEEEDNQKCNHVCDECTQGIRILTEKIINKKTAHQIQSMSCFNMLYKTII